MMSPRPALADRVQALFARPQRLFVTPDGGEFEAWCRSHPGSAVELIVSARALHELVCEPGLPLEDLDAVRGYAQQQFAHYFGAQAQRFAIAPWLIGGAAGASALHGLDLAVLQQQAAAAGVRIAAVRPAWAAWLASQPASVRAGTGSLVWLEAGLATVLQLERGHLTAVQPRRVESLADLGPTPPLAVGRPDDTDFTPQPGPATPAPDFVGRPARSPLALPLAVTGALVLATAAWSAWESRQAVQQAQAHLQRVTTLRSAAPVAAAAAATPARPGARRSAEPDNRGARDAQALLAHPWEAVLTQVETAGAGAPPIAWLNLDVAAGRGEVRLEGLTPDKLLALQLAERLGTAPGWNQVVLSRFSAAETGLSGLRFEISAKVAAGGGS
jgi:hypothetical protein